MTLFHTVELLTGLFYITDEFRHLSRPRNCGSRRNGWSSSVNKDIRLLNNAIWCCAYDERVRIFLQSNYITIGMLFAD
jgi:hypothetical protein